MEEREEQDQNRLQASVSCHSGKFFFSPEHKLSAKMNFEKVKIVNLTIWFDQYEQWNLVLFFWTLDLWLLLSGEWVEGRRINNLSCSRRCWEAHREDREGGGARRLLPVGVSGVRDGEVCSGCQDRESQSKNLSFYSFNHGEEWRQYFIFFI